MRIQLSATILLAFSIPAFAEQSYPPGMPEQITREEALAKTAAQFDEADENGDGILTRDEMMAGMNRMRAEQMPSSRPSAISEENISRIIDQFDIDGDERISKIEAINGFKALVDTHGENGRLPGGEDPIERADMLYDVLDGDKDGYLTRVELRDLDHI